jgi:hypothetical protein
LDNRIQYPAAGQASAAQIMGQREKKKLFLGKHPEARFPFKRFGMWRS